MCCCTEWSIAFLNPSVPVGMGDSRVTLRPYLLRGSSKRASDNVGQTNILPVQLWTVAEHRNRPIYSLYLKRCLFCRLDEQRMVTGSVKVIVSTG